MIKRFEHGGNIYQSAPDGGPWLDFSANINPLGLPESIRQALAAHIDAVVHYPDPAGTALRQALEGAYGVPGGTILLGNGAAELFYLYMHTFRPQRVLLPVPSFSEYERAARAVGAVIGYEYLKEDDDFAFPWEGCAGPAARWTASSSAIPTILRAPWRRPMKSSPWPKSAPARERISSSMNRSSISFPLTKPIPSWTRPGTGITCSSSGR